MITTMKKTLRIAALAALAAGTTAVVTDRPAHAETADKCTRVQRIEYFKDTLLIQCSETTGLVNYHAQIAPPSGCSSFAANLDSIKIWMGMGQSALLAGKSLLLYNTSCGGFRHIRVVDLDR